MDHLVQSLVWQSTGQLIVLQSWDSLLAPGRHCAMLEFPYLRLASAAHSSSECQDIDSLTFLPYCTFSDFSMLSTIILVDWSAAGSQVGQMINGWLRNLEEAYSAVWSPLQSAASPTLGWATLRVRDCEPPSQLTSHWPQSFVAKSRFAGLYIKDKRAPEAVLLFLFLPHSNLYSLLNLYVVYFSGS